MSVYVKLSQDHPESKCKLGCQIFCCVENSILLTLQNIEDEQKNNEQSITCL